jgi:hypothetical protein
MAPCTVIAMRRADAARWRGRQSDRRCRTSTGDRVGIRDDLVPSRREYV